MRRPGNILLLAIFIGALTSAWVYRHLRAQEAAIEAARGAATGATIDVMVASETIPIGTRIAANQVKPAPWPVSAQPEGAVHNPEAVVGRVVRASIEKNEPLRESKLLSDQAGLLPLLITEGMRGMSVKVDDVSGVSGFITPNSRVDVLVAGSPAGNQDQRSKLILQNVKVLATGKTIEQRDEKPIEVPTVTLLVSPADAEKLTLATRQQPVQLALRNYRDEDLVSTPGISTLGLFGREERPAPEPVKVARSAPAPPPRPSVEVLLGDKVTRQLF